MPSSTLQPSARRLPQELTDYIIEHLHNNPRVLKDCTLVSKSWEPTSTSCLFRTWRWPPVHTHTVYPDDTCRCHSLGTSILTCFLFLSAMPRIRNSIRQLLLNDRTGVELVSRALFLQILDLLPSLRDLTCVDLSIVSGLHSDDRLSDRRLHKLKIHDRTDRHGQQSGPDISVFSEIDLLTIGGIPNTQPPLAGLRLPRVKAVRNQCLGDGAAVVLRALPQQIDMAHLERLELTSAPWVDVPAFTQAASGLRALEYHVNHRTAASDAIPRSLPLRVLAIHGDAFLGIAGLTRRSPFDTPRECWQRIMQDVGALAVRSLEELRCSIAIRLAWGSSHDAIPHTRADDVLNALFVADNWSQFRDARGSHRCPRLRRLQISVRLAWLSDVEEERRACEVLWGLARRRLEAGIIEILELTVRGHIETPYNAWTHGWPVS